MEIKQQLFNAVPSNEWNGQLREGEKYKATIVERTSEKEAVLSIRGREVRAVFTNEIPQSERITIEVSGRMNDVVQVKSVSEEQQLPISKQGNDERLNQPIASSKYPQTVQQAMQILQNKGVSLTNETVQQLQQFIGSGNDVEKLETVQALANKKLAVTTAHLNSVHEALHGRSLSEVITDLSKEMNKGEIIRQETHQEPRESVKQKEVAKAIERILTETEKAPVNNELEELRQAKDRIQQTNKLDQAIAVTRQYVSKEAATNQIIEKAMLEASQLQKVGMGKVDQFLQRLDKQLPNDQDRMIVQEIRAILSQNDSFSQAFENLTKLTNTDAKQQLEKLLNQARQLEQVGQERLFLALQTIEQQLSGEDESLADLLKLTKENIAKEADFSQAVKHVRALIEQAQLQPQVKAQIEAAIHEALQRMEQGRELAARERIVHTLNELEQQYAVYEKNEQIQTSVELTSKAVAVTTITEKVAEMTANFKTIQRDLARTLDVVSRQIDMFRQQAQPQAKPLLESVIKKLDQTILRSEMMLLTNMKTEKQLMQASSQLAEAKKLLNKGQYREANQIVKEVKQLVERVHFQPSETKIKHYVSEVEKRDTPQTFTSKYQDFMKSSLNEHTARAMFDHVRQLGLNRDSELAAQLVANKASDEQADMKSVLLKLLQTEEEGVRTSQLAQQALTNITGQQLLSRSDQQGTMQNMFFNLPFLLQEKLENLQVFVNSRNQGDEVDWENCQLYFLIETPRLGEIGIMVQAVERQLSITLKNDKKDFEVKMTPLVQAAIERISEIGYSVNGIKYTKLANEQQVRETKNEAQNQRPIFTEEGFDFKI